MSDKKTFSISELAQEFDVTTRSIRFYSCCTLPATARPGFSAKDRMRLKLTLRGKRMGFSLAEIQELFALWDETATGSEKQLLMALEVVERRAPSWSSRNIAMMERTRQPRSPLPEALAELQQAS